MILFLRCNATKARDITMIGIETGKGISKVTKRATPKIIPNSTRK
jgi:hypothetical protein